MKQILIVAIVLLVALTKCIKSETKKRVLINDVNYSSDNNTNGSFDINISAEYGVQAENAENPKLIQIFPENQLNNSQTVPQVIQQNDLQSLQSEARNKVMPSANTISSYQIQEETNPNKLLYNDQTAQSTIINPRPNLKELHNVVNNIESTSKDMKPSKIVQVLRVPAVYELHMQSDNQNFAPQNLLDKLIMDSRTNLQQVNTPQHYKQPEMMIDQNQFNQQQTNFGGLWQQPSIADMTWQQPSITNEASYNPAVSQNIPGILYLNVPQASFHYMSPPMLNNNMHFGFGQGNYPEFSQGTMYSIQHNSRPVLNSPDLMSAEAALLNQQQNYGKSHQFTENSRKFVLTPVNQQAPSTKQLNNGNNNYNQNSWNNIENQFLKKPQAIHEVPAPNLNKNPAPIYGRLPQINKKPIPQQLLPNVIYGQPPAIPTMSTIVTGNSYHHQALQPSVNYNIRGPLDNFQMKPLTSSYKIGTSSSTISQRSPLISVEKNKNVVVPKQNLLQNNQLLSSFDSNGLNDALSMPTQHLVLIKNPLDDQFGVQSFATTTNQNFDVNKALEGYLDRQLIEQSTQNYQDIVTRLNPAENTVFETNQKPQPIDSSSNNNNKQNQELVTNLPQYHQVNNNNVQESFDQNLVPNLNLFLLKNVDNFENQIPPNVVSKENSRNEEMIDKFESLKLASTDGNNNNNNNNSNNKINMEYTGKPMLFENVKYNSNNNNNNKKYYENQPKFVPSRNVMYPRPFSRSNRRSGSGYGRGRGGSGGYVIYIKERTID